MKVVILAGGMGTRFSEETVKKPKPMIEIGDKPILWHIMKTYAFFGFTEFIICCGYKGNVIKRYFVDYYTLASDNTFNLQEKGCLNEKCEIEPWTVTLANTGLRTLTAGRIMKIKEYLHEEPFFLTYGDGVANINIPELLEFHKKSQKTVTMSTTQPEGRFGVIKFDEDSGTVLRFQEKARRDQGFVNMGFMVVEPSIFDYLGDGSEMLEAGPFERLLSAQQIGAYQHNGFWSPMDTIRDKEYLEDLWKTGNAPWKLW